VDAMGAAVAWRRGLTRTRQHATSRGLASMTHAHSCSCYPLPISWRGGGEAEAEASLPKYVRHSGRPTLAGHHAAMVGGVSGAARAGLLWVWRRRRETGTARGGGALINYQIMEVHLCRPVARELRSRTEPEMGRRGLHSFSCALVLRARSPVSHVSCCPPGLWSHRHSRNRHTPQARVETSALSGLW